MVGAPAMTSSPMPHHGRAKSLVLHLAPGAFAFAVYLSVCLPIAGALGLPRYAALAMMGVLLSIGLAGALLYLGKATTGRLSLETVVLYRERIAPWTLVLAVAGVFGWALVVLPFVGWIDQWLLEQVFASWPAQPRIDTTGYSTTRVIGTQIASVLIGGIITPIAEELYYRGYLLPRVQWMGLWAVPWTATLFALAHFHSPWGFPSRMLLLPVLIYAVQRTRSISVGIWAHCIGNTAGELLALTELLTAPSTPSQGF